jgi:centrosomal protein CEP164
MSKLRELRKEAQVALPTSGEVYTADDGTISTVLDDTYDPQYEPSKQEVLDYAEWLGMELPQDEELLWLAKEGLKAPIPKEWKPCKTDNGEVYYFNFKTGESLWDHPLDEYFKEKFAKEKEKLYAKRAADAAKKKADEAAARAGKADEERRERERKAKAAEEAAAAAAAEASRKKAAAAAAEEERERERKRKEREDADRRQKEEREAAQERREAAAAAAQKRNNITGTLAASSSGTSLSGSLATPRDEPPSPAFASPRLLTEADKKRQAALRKEMEDELKKRIDQAEKEFAAELDKLSSQHRRNIESTKASVTLKLRQAIADVEDKAQDELDAKQKAAETKNKRNIKDLEEQVEEVRERIKRVQKQQHDRVATGEGEIEAGINTQVRQRLAEVEAQVAAERQQHAASLKAAETSERLKLETELDLASMAAKDAANRRYDEAAAARDTAHTAAMKRIQLDADAALSDERARIERSKQGETTQLVRELEARTVSEVLSIEQAAEAELQALRQSEEAALQEQLRIFNAEETGAGSHDNAALQARVADELRPRIDAETSGSLARARAASEAKWKSTEVQLRQARDQRVREAHALAAHAEGGGRNELAEFDAKVSADQRAELDSLRRQYDREAAELEQELKRAAVSSKAAADTNVQAQVASQLDQQIREKQREYRAVEAKNAAALASTDAGNAQRVVEQLAAVRSESEAKLAYRIKEARAAHDRQLADGMAQLVDELTSEEHSRRRAIETEIASPLKEHHAAPSVVEQGIHSELFASKLAELRAEYAAAEARLHSQPFLASQAPRPLATSTGGVNPGRSFTPLLAASAAFGSSIDSHQPSYDVASSYVQEQALEAHSRRENLATARAEWKESARPRTFSAPQTPLKQPTTPLEPQVLDALRTLTQRVDTLLHLRGRDQGLETSTALDIESPQRRRRDRGEPQKRRAVSAQVRRQPATATTQPAPANDKPPRRTSSATRRPSSRAGGGGAGDAAVVAGDDQVRALAARWSKVLHENAGHRGAS